MRRLKHFVVICFLSVIVNEISGNDLIKNVNNDGVDELDDNKKRIEGGADGLMQRSEKLLQDLNFHNGSEQYKVIHQREVIKNETPTSTKHSIDDVRLFLPPDISIIQEAIGVLQDETCREDILLTLQALNLRQPWAMQMLDSSAKFPQGVLAGSLYQLGNFDECVSARLYERDHDVPKIKGKYCLADVNPKESFNNLKMENMPPRLQENSTLHWALCVPHSCEPQEVALILDFILNGAIGSPDAVTVNVSQGMCHFDHKTPYSVGELVYGYIIGVLACLICLATFFHIVIYYRKKDDKTPTGTLTEVVLSFSIVRSVDKLLHVGSSDLNLNCICGIKFLSMFLILAGHSLFFLSVGPIINDEFMKEATQKVENGIFFNSSLMVDTYLFLSGFLMCRLLLLEMDKRKGKVNFLVLYVFRYIRLTPAYLAIIGFYCTWFIRLDQGPLWDSRITYERDRCLDSWWANILYINNYVNVGRMCMFQSWYLSVDTQLFMLAPLIIYPLWKWRKSGEFALGVASVVSVVIPFVITLRDKLDPTIMVYVPEFRDLFTNFYFINVYIKTHLRASSYCIGLFFGYILHRIYISNYKLPRSAVVLGWVFTALFTTSSMFSVVVFFHPEHEYNALEAAAYAALHRVVWCLGVGWVILACVTGNAGPVQKFLCWRPFIPLSRLTYCAYLANGIIELHNFSTVRVPRYMSTYHLACEVLGHVTLTFTLAFLLCLMFESPIHAIEGILLKKEKAMRRKREAETAEA